MTRFRTYVYHFIILAFLIAGSVQVNAQSTAWNLTITGTDQNGNQLGVELGTEADATNGFDAGLDQYAPPAPPNGSFDIRITADGEDWQHELASDVLNWCLELYPIRKQKPLLTLVEGKSHLAGEYCFYNNSITIYRNNNVIRRELINTVIHEYFHYYLITSESKSKLYHDQLEQFSLAQHPQEILCNTMGETLTKVYLKNN